MIILDLGLPDEDGQSVLQKLREWYTNPVLILSVKNNEEDIIRALDNSANDYLVKPFRSGELLARIRSALRNSAADEGGTTITCGEIAIDLEARSIKKNNESIKPTATEYRLLPYWQKMKGKC